MNILSRLSLKWTIYTAVLFSLTVYMFLGYILILSSYFKVLHKVKFLSKVNWHGNRQIYDCIPFNETEIFKN